MDKWTSFFDLISTRRSIRKFLGKKVEAEKIKKMLEALRLAPSSSNSQPWHIVLVQDRNKIEQLSKAAPLGSRSIISWLKSAPLIFVLTVKKELTHKVAAAFGHANIEIDAGIGGQHLALAAHALGLGACWIGWFNENKIKKLFQIPKNYKVMALIPCGYPGETPQARSRKEIGEIASFESFGKTAFEEIK